MNSGLEANHPSIHYYDSDYPWAEGGAYPENFDDTTKFQGVAHDFIRYGEIASETTGPILELCCGTGRIAIPLARSGREVTGVDVSKGVLTQFQANLKKAGKAVAEKITLVEQNITELSLDRKNYNLAIIAFNSLLCIPTFEGQLAALRGASSHLSSKGCLVIDIVNPLKLPTGGDPIIKPFFTRRNTHNGNIYTRFAAVGPFDDNHRQELYGWYDETDYNGFVKRTRYSLHWRPIFRFEIELMLKEAGFKIKRLEGGHQKEPYTAQSPRMFIQAEKS